MIELSRQTADIIAAAGRSDRLALLIDDRLDVARWPRRKLGIKVDGVHVGQGDIPVSICRDYLGEEGCQSWACLPARRTCLTMSKRPT